MRQQRFAETGRRATVAAWTVVILIAALAAGCDSSVDVRGPRFVPPTVPTPDPPTGATVTETRPIAGVNGLEFDAVGQVAVQLGASEALTITAPESVMPRLTSEVVNGRLILDLDASGYQGQASDIQFDVRLRQLDELVHSGVGEVNAQGIDAARFTAELSGVGNVRVAGRADRQELRITGLGDYLAASLETRVASVDMASGDAVIWATERIEGRVAFGCTLEYLGDPVVDVTGGGTVRKISFGS